ncbi:MAG: BF3164 family lipoprotein [Bacteroidales bacterium]
MRILTYFFSIAISTIMLIGCQAVNHERDYLINIREIPPKMKEAATISSTLNSYRFVKLETTEESIMSDVWKIIKYNNKFYISTFFNNKFFVFDNNGKFITKMFRVGSGPGEYISLQDFDVIGNIIVILDGKQVKLYTNDKEMKFIKSIDLDFMPWNIKCISETKFCIYASKQDDVFYIIDNNGKILNSGFPANQATRILKARPFTKIDNENFIVKYGLSNDLVCYNNSHNRFYNLTIFPKGFIIDAEQDDEYTKRYADGYLSHLTILTADDINSTTNKLLVPVYNGIDYKTCYVADSNSGDILHFINGNTKDDITYRNNILVVLYCNNAVSDDSFISYISPYTILETILENNSHKGEANYDRLVEEFGNGKLKENDNPVLVELKFK